MAEVLPIRGMRFSSTIEEDYHRLITPPYDVITAREQEMYYKKSPYNIIRLDYGRSLPGDTSLDNKYTRAAATLKQWLCEGVLQEDNNPALYFYELQFYYNGLKYTRHSICCGVRLSPFEEGVIVPHEKTMSKPKADRLELLRNCEAIFSPVFGLYRDEECFIEKSSEYYAGKLEPLTDFVDEEGSRHRIWSVWDENFIAQVKAFFDDKKIFIADGHHRYETALQYYQEKKEQGACEGYDHTLMALVNIYDDGLLVFPTHRLLTSSIISTPRMLQELHKQFYLQELPEPLDHGHLLDILDKSMTGATASNPSFALYTPERKLYILTLKELREGDKPFPWIDTVVLQELIFSKILGLGEKERRDESYLAYLRDEWEAKKQVDSGEASHVFFVNTPPLEEIISLAEKGIRAPQKSTFFSPKFATGLIMHRLGWGEKYDDKSST